MRWSMGAHKMDRWNALLYIALSGLLRAIQECEPLMVCTACTAFLSWNPPAPGPAVQDPPIVHSIMR